MQSTFQALPALINVVTSHPRAFESCHECFMQLVYVFIVQKHIPLPDERCRHRQRGSDEDDDIFKFSERVMFKDLLLRP